MIFYGMIFLGVGMLWMVDSLKHYRTKNVLDDALQQCSLYPKTGYYRDGYCNTGPTDDGIHVVCSQVTQEFLTFTKSKGNDLSTPHASADFPGLEPGDKWCLCARRWLEAYQAGVAPNVIMESTHKNALRIVTQEQLQSKNVKQMPQDQVA